VFTTLLRPTRPRVEVLAELADRFAEQPLSYPYAGASLRDEIPDGYRPSRYEVQLGVGPDDWQAACHAIDRWAMFQQPWLVMPPFPPPHQGQVVTFASRQLGSWAIHSCRVVATIDEPTRHGFAYGTLATHAVAGEERFAVRRDDDERVWFELWKFARPAHALVHVAQALMRTQQGRFDRGAGEAMRRAVEAA